MRKKAGKIGDRAKAVKARLAARPGLARAKELIGKVRAAKSATDKNSDVKGGKMRKKGTKMFLKSGGRAGKKLTKCTV